MEFVYEDGKGDVVDEPGRSVIETDVDKENYPLDLITDYDTYIAVKAPGQNSLPKAASETRERKYVKYGDNEKPKKPKKTILVDAHKDHIISFIDEDPSAALDEMMSSLTSQFEGLQVNKSAVHKFVTEKCNLSFKQAHLHSEKSNDPETIDARYDWTQ
ncbi:hypothetical protein DFQ28_000435 [Apophysomyces sp. BC1034]|nr:hypothetical protein DFQ29_003958 [Apophysomyces sp. BC1021]KAG0191318.1 hypothetical protein DFQ28_000435 [Apophysomyces sp. BC1034]